MPKEASPTQHEHLIRVSFHAFFGNLLATRNSCCLHYRAAICKGIRYWGEQTIAYTQEYSAISMAKESLDDTQKLLHTFEGTFAILKAKLIDCRLEVS